MRKEGFRQKLADRQKKINSLVCVGLDPLSEKIPSCVMDICNGDKDKAIVLWMRGIINSTAPFASMFKPQKAHYEAMENGSEILRCLVEFIHYNYPDIPIFLDCKRGDIGRTQQRYRIAHFEIDGVDGMNFSPYMGKDCMEHLVDKDHLKRAIVGLCYTSNSSAREVQDIITDQGQPYWLFMACRILEWAEDLGIVENAGLVMAAAHEYPKNSGKVFSDHLKICREVVGNKLWFLIPGVGKQEGFIKETIKAAYAGAGSVAINSSSAINFASSGNDFAEASAYEAKKLRNEIREASGNVS